MPVPAVDQARWMEPMGSRQRLFFPVIFFLTLVSCGCFNPAYTRLPTLQSGSPVVERRGVEHHDPFPSRELGPQTFTRPREFVDQRTEIRRIREDQALRGLDRRSIPAQPAPPGSQRNRYPDAVPP